MNSERPGLVRGLNVWDAGALVVGCVIGAGIFRLSDSVAKFSPSPAVFLLAWVLGGVISLCGALCYAELATLFPRTGGDYIFLTEAYGRFWGFLFGWTKLFVQRTGTIAIIALVFAEHAARVLGAGSSIVKPVATAAIVLLTAANIAGLKLGKNIQNVFTLLKVLAIILIVAVGCLAGKGSVENLRPFWPEWSPGLFSAIGLALIPVLWTYGGWENAAYVAEEVRDPQRNLPRSIVVGLLTATGLYLLVNAVYLYYMPLPEMRATDLVAAGTMDKVWTGVGGRVVAAMVMISTFGALNGFILAGGRILLAMSRDHALFQKLADVNPATHTPAYALACNGAIAVFLTWTRKLHEIVEYTEIVIYLFFALSGLSLFLFRRRGPAPQGSYRVWGYPFTPIVFVLMSLAFAINAILEGTKVSWFGVSVSTPLIGVGIAILGAPLYFLSEKLARKTPS